MIDITKTRKGRQDRPFRGLIYGPAGVGKSSFAADAPDAVFCDASGDTDELDVERLPHPEDGIYTWAHLLESVRALTEQDHPWKTLVIEDLGFIERLAWDALVKRRPTSGKKKIEDIEDYGFMKGYTFVLDEWRMLLERLENLQRKKPVNVIFCAHERVHKYKNPEGDDYGQHAPDVHVNVVGKMKKWCDFILFARPEVLVDVGADKRARAFGTGQRIIQTVGAASFIAKNRFNLPEVLPLDWDAFEAAKTKGLQDAEASTKEAEAIAKKVGGELAKLIRESVQKAHGDANKLARIVDRARAKLEEKKAEDEAV